MFEIKELLLLLLIQYNA